jgi:hypothetical protein
MKYFLSIAFLFLFSFPAYGQSCNYSVLFDEVPPSGILSFFSFADSGSFRVVKSGTNCSDVYRFSTGTPWITVSNSITLSDSGFYLIKENTGTEPRSGLIHYINYSNQTNGVVLIYQDANTCPVTLSEQNISPGGNGASGTINVTADASCKWSARKIADWITLNPSVEQTGSGSISYSVAPNNGVQRGATIKINGQRFNVNQANGCTFTPSATSANFEAGGANGGFTISTNGGCSWQAVPNSEWITVNLGSNWSGSGTVGYTVAANTTSTARTGTITVAGQTFTVNQEAGTITPTCIYSFDPKLIPASGGAIDYGITKSDPDCQIVVRGGFSNPAWVHGYTADANEGARRSGFVYFVVGSFPGVPPSLANGSPQVLVYQASGCVFTPSQISEAIAATGGDRTFTISANGGCQWEAVSQNDWITINLGSSWSGSGTVGYTVAANATGAARTGTITAGGETFTVNQASALFKSRKKIRFF